MDFPELKKLLDENYLMPVGAPVRLELPAVNELRSPALSKAIREYSPDEKLLVPFTNLETKPDQIVLTGTASFFRGQLVERECCVVFQVINGEAAFTMVTTALEAGYDLASDFAPYADTSIAQLPFDSAKLILASVTSGAVTQPVCEQSGLIFEPGLNFNGVPSGAGALAPYVWIFEDLPSVIVHGKLGLDATGNPLGSLEGRAKPVVMGPISIQPGVAVESHYAPPETTDQFLASARFFTIVEIGTGTKIPVRMSTELIGDKPSVETVEIEAGSYQIGSFDDLSGLAGGQNLQALLPDGKYQLPAATKLELSDLTLTFDLNDKALIGIGASVKLSTTSAWPLLPAGVLGLTEIGVTFDIDLAGAEIGVSATIFGQFEIGKAFRYDLSVELPALIVSGSLPPAGSIPVGEFLNALFRPLIGEISGLNSALKVDKLEFLANVREGSFFLSILVTEPWPLTFPLGSLINVTEISLDANYAKNQWGVALGARANLLETIPTFVTAAKAAEAKGWTFRFGTDPGEKVQLIPVIQKFFSTDISTLPLVPNELYLIDVLLEVDSATMDYSFQARAGIGWKLNLGPVGEVAIEASVSITASKKPEALLQPFAVIRADANGEARAYSGFISGKLTIGQFVMTVTYAFDEGSTTLTFTFAFRGITLTAILTTEEDENKQKITVLTASLGDLSFGDVLSYLVNLVDPGLHFQLEAPWDFLNQINFKNLQFKLKLPADKSKWTAEILYNVDQDFVIAHLDKLGLAYVLKNGRRTVDIIITGQFLDQKYTDDKPLSWDLLNEPAPQPAGQGSKLIDIRYLGLGQNVAFRDARSFTNVQSVLDALEEDFKPVDENENPLTSLAPLKFSGDGRWLIAGDLSLLDNTVSLAVVFADPELYGLRIALAGEKAKALAGLEFEILYRKVTDTIGVYALELKLPDAVRQLEFGAVSVTLPIIGIEIYTNGNFRVDFGFPRGGDFSRSFAVQWFPFVGYGGFYFALLNGSTSKKVPVVSNGYFNPVIEFGLGLQVGVGKTIDKGVLKAGATLTAQVILEGVIAWFYPNGASSSSDRYFLIEGEAALVGTLYGSVDFVIIKAEIHVLAKAWATVTIEAYQPTLVRLQLLVEVSASLKILFITVSFSFKMELDLSFTIGSASPTPWIVTSPPPDKLLLRQARGRHVARALKAVEILALLRAGEDAAIDWDWTPRQVFGTKRKLLLTAAPSFTAALENGKPKVTVVMALWTPNSIPASARTAAEVMRVRMAAPQEAPFNGLVEGILRWAIAALPRPNADLVTAEDLQTIADYLADDVKRRQVFTYDRLREFLGLNYETQLGTRLGPTGPSAFQAGGESSLGQWGRWSRWCGGPATPSISDLLGERGPVGLKGADALPASFAAAAEDSGTVFPMIPDLTMGPKGLPEIDFSTYNPVGPTYEACVARLFNELKIDPNQGVAKDSAAPPASVAINAGEAESLATFLFRDYFGLIAKGAVEAAIDLLKKYPYVPRPFDTLETIAGDFPKIEALYRPRKHDTLASVAVAFSASPDQLIAENGEVRVSAGVTPKSILSANPDYLLSTTGPPHLPLSGVQYQIKSGDSVAGAARSLGLTGPTSFFDPTTNLGNSQNASLFEPAAQFAIPRGWHFAAQANDLPSSQAFLRAAAFYTVRGATGLTPQSFPYLAWYKQQIVDLNQNNPDKIDFWQPDLSQWAGSAITVPLAAIGDRGLIPGGTASYTIRPGDSVDFIGGLFEQAQLGPTGIAPLTQAIAALNPQISGPTALLIPELFRSIRPGDSLDRIAELYGAPAHELMAPFGRNAGATGLLRPLAVLKSPTIDYRPGSGDTPARVAGDYDLTLDELAESVKGATGIFPASGPALTIPDVPALGVDRLASDLTRLGRFNSIAAITSRFLLHGLRLPKPVPNFECDGPQSLDYGGLYELAGQQFASPTGFTGDYPVHFTKGPSGDWFRFVSKNPAELDVLLTAETIAENAPSLVLDPQVTAGPTAAPLFQERAPRYGLEQNIHWQAAAAPILPRGATGAVAGQPSLWLFPQTLSSLLSKVPGITGTRPYQLIEASPKPDDPEASRVLDSYAWATALPLRVRRIAGDVTGETLPNSYLLLGVEQTSRDTLLQIWTYLRDSRQPHGANLYLLYQTGGDTNSPALASDKIDAAGTFLLKTNLSTVTHSGPQLAADVRRLATELPPSGQYYARLSAPSDFLQFLWEGSITASGGYYLNYVNANGGGGLPAGVFASGQDANLWLVVVLNRQSGISGVDRSLFPFTNCAAVGQNVSLTPSSLFTRLSDPRPDDLVRVASAPAGVVGFELSRLNPDFGMTGGFVTPEHRTRSLFSLAGFQLAKNDYFRSSPEGLPAGPDTADADARVWGYRQMLPASRFAAFNSLPSSAALPAPHLNPYAGITGSTGLPGPSSIAAIDLAFQDIYGNRSTAPLASVNATVGYTDPLIGPSSWPSLAAGYEFLGSGDSNVRLRTTLQLQLGPYAPGLGVNTSAALKQASADAERYKQIYYQTAQPDVSFALSTNLGTLPAGDASRAFSTFSTNAYLYLETTSQLESAGATAGPSDTLASLGAAYSVTPEALAAANSSQKASQLFANPIAIPQIRGARTGDSLESLAALGGTASPPGICPPLLESTSSTPARINGLRRVAPGPASFASSVNAPPLTPELVASGNTGLPITNGITLRIPQQIYTSAGLTGPGSSLAAIAQSLGCNVYADFTDPATGQTLHIGLVGLNYATPGTLAGNVLLEIRGEQQVTTKGSSFADLHKLFGGLGLTEGEFAVAVANVAGLLEKGAVLKYEDRIIRGATGPVSFDALQKQFGDIDQLVSWNRAVPSVFADGAPVYLNSTCARPAETLDDIAIAAGLTLEQLAAANKLTPLADGRFLEIPNLLRVPQNAAALFVPYGAAQGESLAGIATLFAMDAVTVGNLNAELRGILEPGIKIDWPPHGSTVTTADSSLRSVYLAIVGPANQPPFDDFLVHIKDVSLTKLGAALICQLPRIPGTPESSSLRDICKTFHLADEVGSLAGANQSLDGFLRAGAILLGATGLTATVGPHGTFQQMSEHFQATGATVSVAQMAGLNADTKGLLTTGNPFLLPPRPVVIETPVTAQIPPAGATGEAAVIFPVDVSVTERRAHWLVSPDFQRSTDVFTAQASIPPASAASGPLSVADFARQFETAFKQYELKVATSQDRDPANPAKSKAGIWAVNFGPSGIREFQILQNDPRFYALRPLSTELQNFERVPVSDYQSGKGLCWPPQLKNFESVDLDSWMRELLAAVDLALSAPYSVAAFQLTGATGPASFAGATGATCMPSPGATGPFGPRDYDTLVSAKQDIANGLAKLVEPVLEQGPTSPFYLDDAEQTLRQQMLARLSDAYNFDALVQFPVKVQSPFSSTWTPSGLTGAAPRFSGTLAADLYLTQKDETLAHAADAIGVSTAYLCEALLDVRGIIRPGVTVNYLTPPNYVTTSETTIRVIAEHFKVHTNLADETNWPAWRAFTTFLGDLSTLLNNGASLPLVRASRTILPIDTIGSLEDFFNTGPAAFGHANESPAKDLLRPGAKIDLDPQQRDPLKKRFYTVLAGQTILDIVAGINQQYPALNINVALLCIIARDQQALVNAGKTVHFADLSPDYSVTTAKVSLGTVRYEGASLPPPLTFLMSVKEAATRRKIFLNLRYAVNEAEYGIANVAGVSGYQSSSWLTFALPPTSAGLSTSMQQVAIPLPLRAYPTPPSLLTQQGFASHPDAANIPDARKWDYNFSYESTNADQDTTYLEVSFANRRRQLSGAALGAGQDLVGRLARPLAQFIEVYAKLKPDLAQLPQLGAGGDSTIAAIAFQTLAQLAGNVANAFRQSQGLPLLQQNALTPKQIYSFRVQTAADITGRNLEVLNLQLTGYTGPASGALGFTGPQGGWPDIWVESARGQTALALEKFGPTGAAYLYPPNVPAHAPLTHRVQFDERDVIQNENGWAGVYLTRNENLVSSGPLGPTGISGMTGPIATNRNFVYRTPMVRFIDKLTPLITNQTPIWIESIGTGAKRKLDQYLGDLFDALLDLGAGQKSTGDYTIKLSCNYAFPLGAGSPAENELLASSPLLLRPSVRVGLGNKAEFVAKVSQAIHDWVGTGSVRIDIGRLVFQITVFSAEGEFQMSALRAAPVAGSTAITQPMLDLENLQLKMSGVDWNG